MSVAPSKDLSVLMVFVGQASFFDAQIVSTVEELANTMNLQSLPARFVVMRGNDESIVAPSDLRRARLQAGVDALLVVDLNSSSLDECSSALSGKEKPVLYMVQGSKNWRAHLSDGRNRVRMEGFASLKDLRVIVEKFFREVAGLGDAVVLTDVEPDWLVNAEIKRFAVALQDGLASEAMFSDAGYATLDRDPESASYGGSRLLESVEFFANTQLAGIEKLVTRLGYTLTKELSMSYGSLGDDELRALVSAGISEQWTLGRVVSLAINADLRRKAPAHLRLPLSKPSDWKAFDEKVHR